MSRVVFMPKVDRYEVPTSGSYKLTPYKVKNKFLQKCYDKMFNFLVTKGFVTTKSIHKVDIQMETHEIDFDRVDEQIAMNQSVIEAVYGNRVDTVIMGANIMRNIMKKQDVYSLGQVEFQMTRDSKYAQFAGRNSDLSPRYERVRYRGLNIIMVPWFEGFLLLEKGKSDDY